MAHGGVSCQEPVPDYAVTAIGRDRPGIVAAISRALLELDGNLEDSHMSILRGHFAVMLIARVPDGTDEGELGSRLGAVRDELGLEALYSEGPPTGSGSRSASPGSDPGNEKASPADRIG